MKKAPSDQENFLTVSAISKKEERGFELKAVSFSQQQFRNIAIAGETGSGKSTLMKIIAGLVQPDAGVVLFEGEKVKGPAEKLVAGHSGIAYLSQQFELAGFLRVEQVLKYANTLSSGAAASVYEICRIEHLLMRKTDQLSGGERQRIAIARLLISAPKLLLLDEPYSNLDMVHKNVLKAVIHDIGENLKITCMMVSHDPHDSLSWAHEIIVMKEGQLLQQGGPEQIYRKPQSEYTAGLFGKYNLLPPALGQTFNPFTGDQSKEKKLLIRPESFKIVDKESGGVQGVIKRSTYHGSFYELEVLIKDTRVIVRTENAVPKTGDRIYLQLKPDQASYI